MPSSRTGVLVDRCLPRRVSLAIGHFKDFQGAYLHDVFTNATATEDVQFLSAAGHHGWCVFTQNPDMVEVDDERDAVERNGTKVFCLAEATYGLEGTGMIFGRHLLTIRRRLNQPGECFWLLWPDRIKRAIK